MRKHNSLGNQNTKKKNISIKQRGGCLVGRCCVHFRVRMGELNAIRQFNLNNTSRCINEAAKNRDSKISEIKDVLNITSADCLLSTRGKWITLTILLWLRFFFKSSIKCTLCHSLIARACCELSASTDFLLRNFLASSSHVVSVVNKLYHNRSRQQLLKQRPTCWKEEGEKKLNNLKIKINLYYETTS